MRASILFVTDFADLAVELPLAACVAAWLALSGWPRGARLWSLTLAALLAVMLALKFAVMGCAAHPSTLASPSGHTATATFIYGGIATLALRARLPEAAAIGLLTALLFGASRVLLHVHSVPDVVVGGVAGIAALTIFAGIASPIPAGPRPARLLLACIPVLLILHGMRLNLEPRLRGTGHWLGFTMCPLA